jgi:methylthioribose-1-phosphate isomerase
MAAAQVSTFDFDRMEDEVEIELREGDELRFMGGRQHRWM